LAGRSFYRTPCLAIVPAGGLVDTCMATSERLVVVIIYNILCVLHLRRLDDDLGSVYFSGLN